MKEIEKIIDETRIYLDKSQYDKLLLIAKSKTKKTIKLSKNKSIKINEEITIDYNNNLISSQTLGNIKINRIQELPNKIWYIIISESKNIYNVEIHYNINYLVQYEIVLKLENEENIKYLNTNCMHYARTYNFFLDEYHHNVEENRRKAIENEKPENKDKKEKLNKLSAPDCYKILSKLLDGSQEGHKWDKSNSKKIRYETLGISIERVLRMAINNMLSKCETYQTRECQKPVKLNIKEHNFFTVEGTVVKIDFDNNTIKIPKMDKIKFTPKIEFKKPNTEIMYAMFTKYNNTYKVTIYVGDPDEKKKHQKIKRKKKEVIEE